MRFLARWPVKAHRDRLVVGCSIQPIEMLLICLARGLLQIHCSQMKVPIHNELSAADWQADGVGRGFREATGTFSREWCLTDQLVCRFRNLILRQNYANIQLVRY